MHALCRVNPCWQPLTLMRWKVSTDRAWLLQASDIWKASNPQQSSASNSRRSSWVVITNWGGPIQLSAPGSAASASTVL